MRKTDLKKEASEIVGRLKGGKLYRRCRKHVEKIKQAITKEENSLKDFDVRVAAIQKQKDAEIAEAISKFENKITTMQQAKDNKAFRIKDLTALITCPFVPEDDESYIHWLMWWWAQIAFISKKDSQEDSVK